MSTTPTAAPASSSSAGGGDDARSKYNRQIEDAFEAAGKLSGSALAPTEFYQQFLNRTLAAIDAPAGAVWLRTPQGFLQLACQENIDKVGWTPAAAAGSATTRCCGRCSKRRRRARSSWSRTGAWAPAPANPARSRPPT